MIDYTFYGQINQTLPKKLLTLPGLILHVFRRFEVAEFEFEIFLSVQVLSKIDNKSVFVDLKKKQRSTKKNKSVKVKVSKALSLLYHLKAQDSTCNVCLSESLQNLRLLPYVLTKNS